MAKYSLEPRYEIWDDENGDRIEVGNDRDGLDLVEIRAVDEKGKVTQSITIGEEGVPALIESLQRLLAYRAEKRIKS